jgi:hypothetical protein
LGENEKGRVVDPMSAIQQKPGQQTPGRHPSRTATKRDRGIVGEALRSVYDETVEEKIPPEMLDLLAKLA